MNSFSSAVIVGRPREAVLTIPFLAFLLFVAVFFAGFLAVFFADGFAPAAGFLGAAGFLVVVFLAMARVWTESLAVEFFGCISVIRRETRCARCDQSAEPIGRRITPF